MLRQAVGCLAVVLVLGTGAIAQEVPAKTASVPGSQGTLSIGGKTYKLIHAVAYESKVFDDYLISVLTSNEPIAVDKLKAALKEGKGTDDKFTTFQPQVKLSFNKKSGEVSYCNSYADGHSFSASGGGLKGQVVVKDGRVTGNCSRVGEEGKTNETSFDVKFDLELIPAVIVADDPPKMKEKSKSKGNSKSSKTDAGGDDSGLPNAYDLPITKDATNIDRVKLVEQIKYKSPSDIKTVTAFLIQQFAAQGWSSDDNDLTGKSSTILARTKGQSELTIFVKPDGTGSTVTMMTKGLSWDEKKPAADGTPKEEAAAGSGILAAKFPVPEKATDIERNPDTKMVVCRSKLSAKDVIEFYSKSLTKLGWKENQEETVLIEAVESGLMNFKNGDESIQIAIQDGKPKSKTRIVILGSGLKWAAAAEEKDQ